MGTQTTPQESRAINLEALPPLHISLGEEKPHQTRTKHRPAVTINAMPGGREFSSCVSGWSSFAVLLKQVGVGGEGIVTTERLFEKQSQQIVGSFGNVHRLGHGHLPPLTMTPTKQSTTKTREAQVNKGIATAQSHAHPKRAFAQGGTAKWQKNKEKGKGKEKKEGGS
eukprot:RCo047825